MAKHTETTGGGKGAKQRDCYQEHEEAKARDALREWALRHAKKLGADTKPDNKNGVLPFILRLGFVPSDPTPGTKRRRHPSLEQRLTKICQLAEALRVEMTEATEGYRVVFDWPCDPPASYGALLTALDGCMCDLDRIAKNLNTLKSKHRKSRGDLVRKASALPGGAADWWPENPTNDDLAALSILMGVVDAGFSDDFKKRTQLAKRAASDSGEATHLYGFIHNEAKRCGGLRQKKDRQIGVTEFRQTVWRFQRPVSARIMRAWPLETFPRRL